MKKIFGLTLGGLHQKILSLVIGILAVFLAVFMCVSLYQGRTLTDIVERTRREQQEAIGEISGDTMHSVVESSLVKTNAMQSYIADTMFASVKKDVVTLKTLAEGLFREKENVVPGKVELPDPANDGKVTAQLLYAEGADPGKSVYLPIAAHMTDAMEALYTSSAYDTNVYIGFEDGTHIGVDKMSSNKFDENGKLISFPVCERPWYRGAADSGEIYFSGVMKDTYTDDICVTCSAPVYDGGKLIGVVGIDIYLDTMAAYVEDSYSESGFIAIINDRGQVIFAPENNGLFNVKISDDAEDLRTDSNKELAGFISDALVSATGLRTVNTGGSDYYMTGTPMSVINWTVISVVSMEAAETPTVRMLTEYDRINKEASAAFEEGSSAAMQAMTIIVISVLIVCIVGVLNFAGKIVMPIESITADIMAARTGKLFEMKDSYRTKDEIEVLAEAFDDLSKKTQKYINDITEITKEKERIGTELELARKIQADMLPNIYPAFPDRKEFDIYATMTPAKEVGGDFYDFFLIDSDHLGMVMADVSGKGVPAALFMMMSKILINNYAMQGGSPAKVLEQTNAAICKKNDEEMFVTVWFGVLEISTGKITASNAGHEFPVIRTAGGDFEFLRDKHGFVVGGMDGMTFSEYEIQLEKGGMLFLYTDGLPEATNSTEELFGEDRMLETLNANKDKGPHDLLPAVQEAVDGFVGEAEKFDDLTMLAITLM